MLAEASQERKDGSAYWTLWDRGHVVGVEGNFSIALRPTTLNFELIDLAQKSCYIQATN